MALTVSGLTVTTAGPEYVVRGKVAFDASYTTGGLSLKAADIGLAQINDFEAEPSAGYVFDYDETNKKLIAYLTGSGVNQKLAEVSNGTSLAALTGVDFVARGV